jgi:diguanylate cyclase (GGDEF)-like protein
MRRDRPPLFAASRFSLTWNFAVVAGGAAIAWSIYYLIRLPWVDATGKFVRPGLTGALALILIAVVISELRPLVWAGSSADSEESSLSLSSGLVLASLFIWGPAIGILLQAIATLTGELVKRKAPWRVAFNVGQYVLCVVAASLLVEVMRPVGVSPHSPMGHSTGAASLTGAAILWMLPAWIVYHLMNLTLVAGVAPISVRFRESFFDEFWFYTLTTLAVLVMSAVVVALAIDDSWPFIVLMAIPTYAVYRASSLSWRLHDMAHRDQLTGLPNRRALEVDLARAVAHSSDTGLGCALLLLDLNEFKEVNDTLGHPAGDELLKIVSERAQRVLRPGDTLVRLGGDEFAVVMLEIPTSSDAAEVAQRLRSVISEPARIGNLVLSVGASVGVATYPGDAKDQRTLLQRADVAMYRAKANRSGVEIYQASEDPNSADRLAIRLAFREALMNGELFLHFQPQFELATGAVCGIEGLLRWTHEGRQVPPSEFIAIAGQSELSSRLTDYVLTRALDEARDLWSQDIKLPVSMNISMGELSARYPRGQDLVGRVLAGLRDNALPPWALRLEIAGDRLLGDQTRSMATLQGLAENGVFAALDNFGTGAASLAMLRQLPLAEIKIDRSLVARLTIDAKELTMVRAIIEIAHGLELRVVAEGVENQATADLLLQMGCDVAQGFHFAPVLSSVDLRRWLAERPTGSVAQVRPLRAVGGAGSSG